MGNDRSDGEAGLQVTMEEAHMTNREDILDEVFELALHNDMTYFG